MFIIERTFSKRPFESESFQFTRVPFLENFEKSARVIRFGSPASFSVERLYDARKDSGPNSAAIHGSLYSRAYQRIGAPWSEEISRGDAVSQAHARCD